MTRDQVRYRLDSLVDAGILTEDTYQDHNQIVNEYLFTGADAVADGEACYRGCRILDDDEIEDPSAGTIIALAGRVATLEDDVDDIKDELGIGADERITGLHDFLSA